MQIINIHQAKAHFFKLVDSVMEGEEIIIVKAGKPVIKMVSIVTTKPERKPGALKGRIKISKDFNHPLPDDVLDQFERK